MNTTLRYLLIAALALASSLALADHRGNNRGWGNGRGWNHPGYNSSRTTWSVNVNLGTGYYGGRSGYRTAYNYYPNVNGRIFNSSLGYISLDGLRYNNYYNPRPVIIQQNTYVRQSAPVTVRSSRVNRSLFRDRYGRCYEREYDRYGNESRIELPASACNF